MKIKNNSSKEVQLKIRQNKLCSTLQNFNSNVKESFICNFHLAQNHSSTLCPKSRLAKCKEKHLFSLHEP